MIRYHINELQKNLKLFKGLFEQFEENNIHWRKSEEHWSPLIVACHLRDEEQEDFRPRIELLLENPADDFQPIDPVAWVKERAYEQQDYLEIVSSFLKLREESIKYLKSIDPDHPGWFNEKQHPYFGVVSAEFFLNNWLAHDFLHIRQLTRIRYDYLDARTDNAISYAGQWK